MDISFAHQVLPILHSYNFLSYVWEVSPCFVSFVFLFLFQLLLLLLFLFLVTVPDSFQICRKCFPSKNNKLFSSFHNSSDSPRDHQNIIQTDRTRLFGSNDGKPIIFLFNSFHVRLKSHYKRLIYREKKKTDELHRSYLIEKNVNRTDAYYVKTFG